MHPIYLQSGCSNILYCPAVNVGSIDANDKGSHKIHYCANDGLINPNMLKKQDLPIWSDYPPNLTETLNRIRDWQKTKVATTVLKIAEGSSRC